MSQFQAHGKILLTGEYLVLKGALALAVPLRLGQSMTVKTFQKTNKETFQETNKETFQEINKETFQETSLRWNAEKPDGHWFSATLNPETLDIIDSNDQTKAERLRQILQAVRKLNPTAFENNIHFETHLDFDPNWGLGSSSTLIANLARWADVDPYELLKLTFGGSGYDVACATANQPLYYQLSTSEMLFQQAQEPSCNMSVKAISPAAGPTPLVKPVDFHPPFAEHLFFVYQGHKQSSSKEIKAFLEKTNPIDLQKDIEVVSDISRSVPKCESLDEFGLLMQCHERIIARCIGQEPVQKRFPDFEGTLKSLGAWGGDFILAATEWGKDMVKAFFMEKGLEVIFGYNDLVLKH